MLDESRTATEIHSEGDHFPDDDDDDDDDDVSNNVTGKSVTPEELS